MNIDEKIQSKLEKYKKIERLLVSEERNDWEKTFLVEYIHDTTAIEGNTISQLGVKMILEDGVIPQETSVREFQEIID